MPRSMQPRRSSLRLRAPQPGVRSALDAADLHAAPPMHRHDERNQPGTSPALDAANRHTAFAAAARQDPAGQDPAAQDARPHPAVAASRMPTSPQRRPAGQTVQG